MVYGLYLHRKKQPMGDEQKCPKCGGPMVESHSPSGFLSRHWVDGDACRRRQRVQAVEREQVEKKRAEKAEADNKRLRERFTVPVVCICGSTRFADEHAIARWMLEREGAYICLMINYLPAWYAEQQGWNGHDHFGEASGTKDALDELHKRKIDLCDWVLVVAPQGYIGKSTRAEIEYAESLGRPVKYIESGDRAAEALAASGPAQEGETAKGAGHE